MTDSVEAYLDQLFDLLSGSGARGRRVLLEAQAHLEETVERAMAQGVARETAERQAITRFGTPEQVARAHVEAGVLPVSAALARVFAAAWLMVGVAGLCVGLTAALNAIVARVAGTQFVSDEVGDTRPVAVGAVAIVLLVVFAAARMTPSLRGLARLPNAAMVSTAGAVGFGGVGLVLLCYGALGLALGHPAELGEHLAQGVAGIAAGFVFLPHAWRQVTLDDA